MLSAPGYRRLWYYALLLFHASTFEQAVAGWAVLGPDWLALILGFLARDRTLLATQREGPGHPR